MTRVAVLMRHGERDALAAENHRRVDADHLAALVTSGPPELPGLSAASVWIRFSISRTVRARSDRPSALTTPAVTVCWKPNGLPMAIDELARLEAPTSRRAAPR